MWRPGKLSWGFRHALCNIHVRMRLPWRRNGEGAAAVAEPPVQPLPSLADLRSEIDRLSMANRADPDAERARAILRARHLAGIRLLDDASAAPELPDSDGVVGPR